LKPEYLPTRGVWGGSESVNSISGAKFLILFHSNGPILLSFREMATDRRRTNRRWQVSHNIQSLRWPAPALNANFIIKTADFMSLFLFEK